MKNENNYDYYDINDDIELNEDDYAEYDEFVSRGNSDNSDDFIASTIPIPTYDKKNRIDYIEIMKEYNSEDEMVKEKAAETIIRDLTGLILYIIKKKYANYSPKFYDDLVQSGELGILIGLKDYDPTKSLPATYFSYFIIHEIQCFINSNVYRTTPYYSTNMKKINKAIAKFESVGLAYTNRDISIQTGIPLDTVEKVIKIMNGKSEVSLDTFGDQLEGSISANPEEEFFKKEHSDFLGKVMHESLTEEEMQIMLHLFGIGDAEPLSLKAIAKKLGLPIDRIKKLKTTAFCKLRNSALAQVHPSGFQTDMLELEDEDSITLFPHKQAIDSAEEMKDLEIVF